MESLEKVRLGLVFTTWGEQTYKGKVRLDQPNPVENLCVAVVGSLVDRLLVAGTLVGKLRNPLVLLLTILPTSLLVTLIAGGIAAIWFLFGCMALLVYLILSNYGEEREPVGVEGENPSLKSVFSSVARKKPGSIVVCPVCGGRRIRLVGFLSGWLTPHQYFCGDCGYRGAVVCEEEG